MIKQVRGVQSGTEVSVCERRPIRGR